jgi:uncharacterized protein
LILKWWDPVPSNWYPYFEISDCDGWLTRAQRKKANLMAPAQTVPSVGRFAVLTDPQGVTLGVLAGEE